MSHVHRWFAGWWFVALVGGGLGASLAADEWPHWRGPNGNGTVSDGSYPTRWSASENVRWRCPLPGRGSSTPCVWDGAIYVTCEADDDNAVLRLDRDGKEVWRRTLGKVRPAKHRKGTGCNPSPLTDGKHLFVYFKSGDLGAFLSDGTLVWQANPQSSYGQDTLWWDLGTSPIHAQGKILIACIQSDNAYLVAYNAPTGDVVWKVERNLAAPEESNQGYSTPVLGGTDPDASEFYVLGADHVTAHAVDDGREVWRLGGLNPEQNRLFRSIASAVLGDRQLFVPYARGATLTAVRLGGQGDITATHVAWKRDDMQIDVPTPAYRDGKLYVCSDRGDISCLDASSGRTLWKQTLRRSRSTYSASPILAGRHLYVTREDGVTSVVDIEKQGELVAENDIGEPTVSTPVLADGCIFLRTFDSLFCIHDGMTRREGE